MENLTLPDNSILMKKRFLYGVATSSYQIEGDVESRLPCIWDTFCKQESAIVDGSDGAKACEHIKRWEQDLDMIASLHVDAYRFSISWPRVMHQNGTINEVGIKFYEALVDGLTARGIKSFVTLYHWDLPQYLEDNGGWLNRATSFAFAQYAETIAKRLGDKVASYATFNEPFCSAYLGYEVGVHAPGVKGVYAGRTAAHHILLAHGLGMKKLRKHLTQAQLGIVVNVTPCYRVSDLNDDIIATKKANEYINHWYIKPLFDKRYPDIFNELKPDQKPPIEEEDFDIISQPMDFIGINYYTRLTYSAPRECDQFYYEREALPPKTDMGWEIYPQALTDILLELNSSYSLPPVYITENGAAMPDKIVNDEVKDYARVDYFQQHLLAVHHAVEAGVNIKGYFAWSLMDNFEWAEGLSKRFGLVYVNYATQKRTLKTSAHAYSQLLKSRTE